MSDADYLAPINRFARDRMRAFATSAIHRIQRVKASGAQGADYKLRTLWNEYSWEIQNGDGDLVGSLVEDLVTDIIAGLVSELPDAEAVLLTCAFSEDEDDIDRRNDEVIINEVLDRVSDRAASRNLDRLDPDYRWYENL